MAVLLECVNAVSIRGQFPLNGRDGEQRCADSCGA
jgi:hypothetical protein